MFLNCNINQGINSPDGDFYSEAEAETKLGIAVSLKLSMHFNDSHTFLPYEFQEDSNCRNQSFYLKKEVNNCANLILITDFKSSDISDYFGKVGALVREVCKLEKQIFLYNSFSGEINFCNPY
ncbi:hypothetical protein CH361_13045 [Leptospira brenneri]|nr:hypothetical protein CH361_13045 [Leptospira brenneri]